MSLVYAFSFFLMVVAVIAAIIALLVCIFKMFPKRRVNLYGKVGVVSVHNEDHQKAIRVILAERKTALKKALSVFLVAAAYLAVFFYGGVSDSLHKFADEQDIARGQSIAKESFINPPTDTEAFRSLGEGEAIMTDIVLPDGQIVKAKVASYKILPFGSRSFKPVGAASEKALKPLLNGDDEFALDAATQKKWFVHGKVYGALEDTYRVSLDEKQRSELDAPMEEPEHLTRYGSTPLTTSLGDGVYFNGTVTLIWDGDYRLIGSEGTDQAAELARK